MKRLLLFAAYVTLVMTGAYVFELNQDWRPDKDMLPASRMLFAVLALLSIVFFGFDITWWLPAATLLFAFTIIPWALSAGISTTALVYFLLIVAFAGALGRAFRAQGQGS
jgi:hypothetical protein